MGMNDSALEGALPAEGFRLGQKVFETADAAARQRIAELEKKVALLEARPAVWAGKNKEEYDAACEKGIIREGDIIILDDDTGMETDQQEGGGESDE